MASSSIQKRKIFSVLSKNNPLMPLYYKALSAINQEFIITNLSVLNLINFRESLKKKDPSVTLSLSVPSISGTTVHHEKRKSKIVEMLKHSTKCDIYASSLGNHISIVEFFLQQLVVNVLKKYPQKLSVDVNNNQTNKTVQISKVLSATNLDEVIDSIIIEKVSSLFYASPSDYIKYMKKVLGVRISDDLFYQYIEIKATRDLVVHNNKKVNDLYIEKSGQYARVTDKKQNIPITEKYYLKSVSIMKNLVRSLYIDLSESIYKITDKNDLFIRP